MNDNEDIEYGRSMTASQFSDPLDLEAEDPEIPDLLLNEIEAELDRYGLAVDDQDLEIADLLRRHL